MSCSHLSAGAVLVLDPEAGGDALFARVGAGLDDFFVQFGIEHQGNVEKAFVAPAQQRQRAVGGHVDDGFGEVEPVAELGAFGFLAFDDGRFEQAVFLQVVAQRLQELRVFGELLHQDLAGAVEHRLGVGEAGFGVEVFLGFFFWRQFGVVEQAERQRLDAGFAGDLRLGPALLLVRQVEVFQALLRFGVFRSRRAVPASACPVPRCWRAPRRAGLRVRAGSPGALPACAVACRRVRR